MFHRYEYIGLLYSNDTFCNARMWNTQSQVIVFRIRKLRSSLNNESNQVG